MDKKVITVIILAVVILLPPIFNSEKSTAQNTAISQNTLTPEKIFNNIAALFNDSTNGGF